MKKIALSLLGVVMVLALAGCHTDYLEQAHQYAPDAVGRINTVKSISSNKYNYKGVSFRDELFTAHDLMNEKERQRWEDPAVILVEFNYGFIYVNRYHPDYEKFRGKHPGDKIELVLTDKPSENILPAWARFVRVKE